MLAVFDLFKFFRYSISKSIEKPQKLLNRQLLYYYFLQICCYERFWFFLIRNKSSSRTREAGNANKSIFMLTIFDLFKLFRLSISKNIEKPQ